MEQLYTRWGKEIDENHVLQEYPRPLLIRNSYMNLNGIWEYAFTKEFRKPETYEGKILVPFSPESVLSGVGRQLKPDEYLWYRCRFSVTIKRHRKWGTRRLLHFGAVDQSCVVYVNGHEAARHTGGYLPFEADITELLVEGENELIVSVKDLSDTSYHSRGKQKLKRGGMFYTAQSGIWQTVWMEETPHDYIREIITHPDLDSGTVKIYVKSDNRCPVTIQIHRPAIYQMPMKMPSPLTSKEMKGKGMAGKGDGKVLAGKGDGKGKAGKGHGKSMAEKSLEKSTSEINAKEDAAYRIRGDFWDYRKSWEFWDSEDVEYKGNSNEAVEIKLSHVFPWSCESPYLYYFTVKMGADTAVSYFAMRSFTVEPDKAMLPRICLNHEALFQKGVLDQGYWPDGLYTAPSDEALIYDIQTMKDMGFNMMRKHIKIEPQRWYYHCDRLGMVVWQDMVNGGSVYRHWFVTVAATALSWHNWRIKDVYARLLSRGDKAGRLEFIREMKETVRLLKGHPSIAVWVIFNEGWGQFQTADMTEIVRRLDPMRLIDQASGWFDQGGGDFQSLHNYFFKLRMKPERTRATVLSEFGGYSLREEGHSACRSQYGYGIYTNRRSLNRAYQKREKEVARMIPRGLCASVYTQVSDVEEEVNGILTYDRELNKLSNGSEA